MSFPTSPIELQTPWAYCEECDREFDQDEHEQCPHCKDPTPVYPFGISSKREEEWFDKYYVGD